MKMFFAFSKVSDGNMDFRFGSREEVLKNRQKFFKKLDINSKEVAEVQQVHGTKVLAIEKIPNPATEADGLITSKTNIYLMLKVADCMAVALFDPKNQVIALVHVGWQGLEKRIIENAVKKLINNFGSNSQDFLVQISPSIGPCCYRINLWGKASEQLIKLGVLEKNINNPQICTYHTEDYFSHRRSEDKNLSEGRFVTILGFV